MFSLYLPAYAILILPVLFKIIGPFAYLFPLFSFHYLIIPIEESLLCLNINRK